MPAAMSFIYIRKSMGPRTEPWGTQFDVTSMKMIKYHLWLLVVIDLIEMKLTNLGYFPQHHNARTCGGA